MKERGGEQGSRFWLYITTAHNKHVLDLRVVHHCSLQQTWSSWTTELYITTAHNRHGPLGPQSCTSLQLTTGMVLLDLRVVHHCSLQQTWSSWTSELYITTAHNRHGPLGPQSRTDVQQHHTYNVSPSLCM